MASTQASPTYRSAFKRLMFSALTIMLGSVTGVGLAEVGLRIAGWPAPGFYLNGRGPLELRIPGRQGGAYRPNSRGELRHYDYSVEWSVNSYGYRDREAMPKAEGEWRIGILGDSFTAGVGVKQNERFGEILGRAISQQSQAVTVWNLGAPICGTACEAEMLRNSERSYQLDEVILAFYGGNDLEDNTEWYRSVDTSASPGNSPTPASRLRGWLRENSRLASFLWVYGIRGFATFRPPGIYSQASIHQYWPDTERALAQLREVVGLRPLTILYLPAIPEWDDTVWQELRQGHDVPEEGRYVVKQLLASWSTQNGVEFIDATDWLRQCPSAKQCVFPVDSHWHARGHSLVAEGLTGIRRWPGGRR
jgi:hypothetical protein